MKKNLFRLSQVLKEIGYCKPKDLKNFLYENRVEYEGDIIRPTIKSGGILKVDPEKLIVNGEKVEYFGPLSILINRPMNYVTSYPEKKIDDEDQVDETDEEENENIDNHIPSNKTHKESLLHDKVHQSVRCIFDLFPKLFSSRHPKFEFPVPLPKQFQGLDLLSQYENVRPMMISSRDPIPRTYEIKVNDNFTGLELETIKLIRGDVNERLVHIIPPPDFTVVNENEKVARLTLYDYKPDNIIAMFTALRHQLVSVRRIGLGNLLLKTSYSLPSDKSDEFMMIKLKEGDWITLNDDHYAYLFRKKFEYDEVRRNMQNKESEDQNESETSDEEEEERDEQGIETTELPEMERKAIEFEKKQKKEVKMKRNAEELAKQSPLYYMIEDLDRETDDEDQPEVNKNAKQTEKSNIPVKSNGDLSSMLENLTPQISQYGSVKDFEHSLKEQGAFEMDTPRRTRKKKGQSKSRKLSQRRK